MKKTTVLRKAIMERRAIAVVGCHDAMSAKVIEACGFEAIQISGYGLAASLLGKPDVGLVQMKDVLDITWNIAQAVSIPVMADVDTGGGNAVNAAWITERLVAMGVAGMNIEDQVFPKRCGHMSGKAVIPVADWIAKIKAALDARVDPDLVIMARTDAIAVNGIDDAIERARLAREAGADLIFVEAPTRAEDMRRICTEVPGPCLANNVETGLSPLLSAAELQAIGYAAVVFPVAATYAVAYALRNLFATIRATGSTATFLPQMLEFNEFNDLVGLSAQRSREAALQEFADALVARHRR
jgi:2-methylisocitrate lyase-like PEP mutase family enzyme